MTAFALAEAAGAYAVAFVATDALGAAAVVARGVPIPIGRAVAT